MSLDRREVSVTAAAVRHLPEVRSPEPRQEEPTIVGAGTKESRERVALATRYREAGRQQEAESLCREALFLAPGDVGALRLGAMLAHAAGRQVEALELIDRAVALRPLLDGGHRVRGDILLALARPDEALAAFRESIAFLPLDPQAWYGLGQALRTLDRPDEALLAYQESTRLYPDFAEPLLGQGIVHLGRGRAEEGLIALQTAARVRPDLAVVQDQLGSAYAALHRWEEAIEAHRRAIALDPSVPAAYCHLGVALREAGRYLDAVDALQAALALEPQSPDAHNMMGTVLRSLGYPDQALSAFRQALAGRPDFAEAHFHLGGLLADLDRSTEALASFRAALAFRAEFAAAHAQMGGVLLKLGRAVEAITAYRHALGLEPKAAETWFQLGNAMREERRPREAIAAYDRAIELAPDYPAARYQRGLVQLGLGEFAEGWKGFEWRYRIAALRIPEREFGIPRWGGEALQGRAILVHTESGVDDVLRLVRYLPLVAARGGRIILECPGSLRRFLESMPSISQVVPHGDPLPEAHCHIPLASLGRLFTNDLVSLPAETPYLPTRIWSSRIPLLPAGDGLRVGIAWNGGEGQGTRGAIPPAALAPLFTIGGITWYSLESVAETALLRPVAGAATVHDLAPLVRDFADTATLLGQLDLVVTASGVMADLAGGLGVEVWVMLPSVPHWAWGTEGVASAWYPSARLVRQSQPGAWAMVIEEVRRMLSSV